MILFGRSKTSLYFHFSTDHENRWATTSYFYRDKTEILDTEQKNIE